MKKQDVTALSEPVEMIKDEVILTTERDIETFFNALMYPPDPLKDFSKLVDYYDQILHQVHKNLVI
ncbi:hypothetical protein [Pedobacter sp. V48]|jgi:hypothetical protein|uniref:hypothetical protein n=1 Tax=Pedobacter sp. V48 TaxID=509635 RepID=UPI0003E5884D|nr:hypothetical protein [Pedobacter sp. V48]ETZ20710.1 hypothetical protein N824_03755 [Pedobacter sp. V48]